MKKTPTMKLLGLSLMTGFVVCLQSASATLTPSYFESVTQNAYAADIQTTDLINQGQPTFLSSTSNVPVFSGLGFTVAGITDGQSTLSTSGSNGRFAAFWNGGFPVTLTFNLNLTTSPTGYDITQIQTIAGWTTASNYNDQQYTLWVEPVGSSTFNQVGGNIIDPVTSGSNSAYSSKTVLTDSGGVIASGIQALQFIYTAPHGGSLVIQEIDANGTPSVIPEPSSCALLAVGVVFLARRRRRA